MTGRGKQLHRGVPDCLQGGRFEISSHLSDIARIGSHERRNAHGSTGLPVLPLSATGQVFGVCSLEFVVDPDHVLNRWNVFEEDDGIGEQVRIKRDDGIEIRQGG